MSGLRPRALGQGEEEPEKKGGRNEHTAASIVLYIVHSVQPIPYYSWPAAHSLTVPLSEQHHWISHQRKLLPLDVAIAPA